MTQLRLPSLALTLLTLSGCYGAAPARPATIAVPELRADARLSVHSESTTQYENVNKESETCPSGKGSGSPECVRTTYTVKEPVTRTVTTAAYGDQPIDFAQFKVLSDPGYDQKLMLLEDHSEACQEANLPRYIGMGLALAGTAAYIFGSASKPVQIGGLIGIGGGLGSYTAGYFMFGGKRCNEAAYLHSQVNYASYQGVDKVNGSVTATEMQALADDFNQRISPMAHQ